MKTLLALLCACLCLLPLSACGDDTVTSDPVATNSRKIGLGVVGGVAMDGTDQNRVKITVAAVVLDADGRIRDCELDELEFKVGLQGGQAQLSGNLTTKGELGDDYVPNASDTGRADGLTAPWEDQAEAFCDYAEGKMVSEITGLATTDGKSEQIDGCDLLLTDIIQAVDRASKMAMPHDIAAGDDLKLAVLASSATDATAENPQYDVELAAVTLNEGDKITGCMTDTMQVKLTVTDGVFTTVSGPVESKRQKGDAYGMKEASGIKREWYEQADAFDTFVRGKTASEVAGLTLDATGQTDAISGCTIAVSGLVKSVAKAAQE